MRGEMSALLAGKKSKPPTIVEERVLSFLQQVPPFQFLEKEVLGQVVAQTEMHFFPKDTYILLQNGAAADYLYIIERGGVKESLLTELDEEEVVEVVGEGELFGILASMEGELSRTDVVALTDTICYAIPRSVIQELLECVPAFAHYLLQFSIHHYLDWSLAKIRHSVSLSDATGQLLFTGQVRELAHTPLLVTCPATTTIQQAAQLMSARQVSSVVVVDESGRATGIMTDWDLREQIIAAGWDIQGPVGGVMSAPVITLGGDEPIYQAVRLMIAHNIHHIVVTEGDQPVGLITAHDLIVLQGTSALFIAQEIGRQADIAGLRRLYDQAQRGIPVLLRQGVRASQLGWLMADINDRLVAQVIKLSQTDMGPPPVPYCWLVLGSEGRREQTFKTDQDNALIYANPPPELIEVSRAYFLELGRRVVAALIEIGFPPCPGQLMANDDKWVQPLKGWQDYFQHWTTTWDLTEIVEALIFFDLRAIYGDPALADQLYNFILDQLAQNHRFLVHLAHLSIRHSPPVGFLGRFILESNGEHQDEFNLKQRGTMPIVDLVRFFALRHGLNDTNTMSRLEILKAGGHLPANLADELAQAFEFMLNLRIQHQWEQLQANQAASNYINPKQLSVLDRRLLREAFKVIAQTQTIVREEYHVKVGRLF